MKGTTFCSRLARPPRGEGKKKSKRKRNGASLDSDPCKKTPKELDPNAFDEDYKVAVRKLRRNPPEQRDLTKTTLFVPFHFSGGSGGAIGPSTPFLSKSGGLCVANDGGLAVKVKAPLASEDGKLGFDSASPLKAEKGKLSISMDASLTLRENGKLSTSDFLSDHKTTLNVLTSGDLGCKYFRIPFVYQRANGDLIAGADARYDEIRDFGRTGIAVCVSYDGGLSFPKKTVILPKNLDKPKARYLDAALVENARGKLFLFAVYFENTDHINYYDENWDFVCYTSYDALEWSGPISFRKLYYKPAAGWELSYCFQSPDNGIILQNGTVVLPVQRWGFGGMSGRPRNFQSGIMYSTDDGDSWKFGRHFVENDTNECAIIEYPQDNQIMCIAKKSSSANTQVEKTRSVYTTADLAESAWMRHRTDDTLRMRNAVQCSAISFVRGEIFEAPRQDMRIALFCSPLVNEAGTAGRGYITLQYMTEETLDWIPSSVITPVPTLGYTGLALDKKRGRLYVAMETQFDEECNIWLVNCSDAWGMLKTPMVANVNQGFEVSVNEGHIDQNRSDVRYRYEGTAVWIGGTLVAKGGGSFPDTTNTKLFDFDINYGISPRKGFITAFGLNSEATVATPFALYYEREAEHAERIVVKTYTLQSTGGVSMSQCSKLFIPDCRVITFC